MCRCEPADARLVMSVFLCFMISCWKLIREYWSILRSYSYEIQLLLFYLEYIELKIGNDIFSIYLSDNGFD